MNKFVTKKNAWMILAIALTAVFITGCSKSANTGNSTNSSSNSSAANTTANTNASPGTATTAAAGSPMAVLKAFNEASDKKDFEGAKSHLSASSITYLEERAKKKGKTLEQDFRESRSESAASFPLSNEQISGDTATVDMKTPGPTVTVPFVKENGAWKLAIDKYMESDGMSSDGAKPKAGSEEDEDEAPKEK